MATLNGHPETRGNPNQYEIAETMRLASLEFVQQRTAELSVDVLASSSTLTSSGHVDESADWKHRRKVRAAFQAVDDVDLA